MFEDRCLQTAQPVSKALGIPIYVEHGQENIGLLLTILTAISFLPRHMQASQSGTHLLSLVLACTHGLALPSP